MNVYKITDCDWYAGETFEEAVKCAKDEGGVDEETLYSTAAPMTEGELRKIILRDPDDGPNGESISGWDYLQQLASTGRNAIFFMSTEW